MITYNNAQAKEKMQNHENPLSEKLKAKKLRFGL